MMKFPTEWKNKIQRPNHQPGNHPKSCPSVSNIKLGYWLKIHLGLVRWFSQQKPPWLVLGFPSDRHDHVRSPEAIRDDRDDEPLLGWEPGTKSEITNGYPMPHLC
jgi:hypothetical protein